MTHVHTQ